MGSNAIIVDLKAKEYVWLAKSFYPSDDEEVLDEDMQIPIINALVRFLHEHQGGELRYGFAQHLPEFIEACHAGCGWDWRLIVEQFTELPYSKGT